MRGVLWWEPHLKDWLTINAAQNPHIGRETTTSDCSGVNCWQTYIYKYKTNTHTIKLVFRNCYANTNTNTRNYKQKCKGKYEQGPWTKYEQGPWTKGKEKGRRINHFREG